MLDVQWCETSEERLSTFATKTSLNNGNVQVMGMSLHCKVEQPRANTYM